MLGSALIAASVALPAFALVAGDLDTVAGWANVLALPISALGLVFVLADRAVARDHVSRGGVRRAWMDAGVKFAIATPPPTARFENLALTSTQSPAGRPGTPALPLVRIGLLRPPRRQR